jgi:hypothetical protein
VTIALLYLLVITVLILWNGFFGIFNDERLSRRKLATFFFLKALAIPVFFFVYHDYYGGLSKFDTGKFYSDAVVLNNCAKKHPLTYVKLLVGIEDNKNAEHQDCIAETQNWQRGKDGKFFYNDNRVLIRVHSLLHFIAFDSWQVHSLFSCFFGFIGLFWIYCAFKDYLPRKETATMAILCLFPALWFYSGALLKEGLVLFVMGGGIYLLRNWVVGDMRPMRVVLLAILLAFSTILKPYLLITAFFCFGWFFHIIHKATLKSRSLYYLAFLVIVAFAANLTLKVTKGKSMGKIISKHQRTFKGASSGGIFLAGETTYLRLNYDTTLVTQVPGKKFRYTVHKGVPYMYWMDMHNRDTLYNTSNQDTVTQYELAFMSPKGSSNFDLPDLCTHRWKAITWALYYALFHPFFINADNALQMLASFENLLLLLAIGMVMYGMVRRQKSRLFPTALMSFAIIICLIVSLSSPNSGAVFRYRAPAVIFILLAALYYYEKPKRQLPEYEN